MSAALVPDLRSNRRRKAVQALQQFLHCEFGKRGIARHGLVEVVHVCLIMLVVVDLHRLRIDVGLERIVGVGELGQIRRDVQDSSCSRRENYPLKPICVGSVKTDYLDACSR